MKLGNNNFLFEISENNLRFNFASLRIWFGDIYIGTLDSETYLPSLIYQLFSIFDDKYYRKEVDDKNATNILHLDDFLLTLEETFDDFIKRVVRGEEKIYWSLVLSEDHFFKYENVIPEVEYIKEVYIDEYICCCNAFIDFLKMNKLVDLCFLPKNGPQIANVS